MVAPSRPRVDPAANPRQEYREKFGRPARYVPTDKFFAAFDDLIARKAPAQDLRMLALQEVQRAHVSAADKIKLFIPTPRIAGAYGIEDILHAINRESQSATWDGALNSLCDFVCVRGHGIRFTCTNRDIAIKLGGTAVSCMGQKLIVKPYSVYERLYFVDLTRVPSELDDDMIYDYFVSLGLQPIIAPTHQAGTLMSRDRTVWFPHYDVPDALFVEGQPLREIHFAGFDNPVYVQHKKRVLNRVVPPSIVAKRVASEQQARAAKEEAAANKAKSKTPREKRASTKPMPSTPPAPAAPDGTLIVERPAAMAPVQDWIKISRHAQCSGATVLAPGKPVAVATQPDEADHLVFGFPVQPTSFELAFSSHDDEETAGDADCLVHVDSETVSGTPMALSDTIGNLVANRSFLNPKTNAMKRSEYRRKARKAAKALPDLSELEDRLAAIMAQPSAYAATVHTSPPEMAPVETEHALLRLYSGRPAATHGKELSFMRRVCVDYTDTAPEPDDILVDQLPDDSDRAIARAYARMDLFFRTHAPAIYYDPVKVAALCGDVPVTCHQYSAFLIWSDQTLASLCASKLGKEYEGYLSAPVLDAMQKILDDHVGVGDENASMASSDQGSTAVTTETPADDESMGSTHPEATHL